MIEHLGLPKLDRPGTRAMAIATWIDATGRGLFGYFYLLYLTREVGFKLGTAGAVLSAVTALGLGITPVAGSMVDRIGAKRMLVASQVVCAIGYFGLLFVTPHIPVLFAAAACVTVGECIFWVGYPSLVSQVALEGERDRWFAFMGMTRMAGIGLGGLIAAGILAIAGNHGYRILLAGNVITFVIAGTLIFLRSPNPTSRVVAAKDSGGWMAVVRDRAIMQLAAAHGFGVLAILIVFQGLPLYVIDQLGLPGWVPGILLFVNTVMLATGQSLGLRLVAGWRRTRVYVLAATIWVGGATLFGIGDIVPRSVLIPYMIVTVALASGGEILHYPLNGSVPTALAPEALRGRYLALFSLVWSAAGIVSPSLVSALVSVGGAWLWVGMGSAAALAGMIALWSERVVDPEIQRTAPRQARAVSST
jgi:MFS family permease